ncbi:ArsR/SmtB family transcription factor [Methanobacterium alcaliphilum]|uniref:ArsR/SmtB family transcription factor n=1 Tax=Methanobacterium alcaliphilum TaxID=392018 RepID=UPI00200B425E|nr:metalloregulator ArsR/SmtB family transcription factor [Methanobacterium alcaliphilum]MCK9151184.1 metalloregulator ArsR/SmtB family transcription factor [Methanobacterium alcaliphilum]
MKEEGMCEIEKVNEEKVKDIKNQMLSDDLIIKVTDNFKTISDPTRLKILHALSKTSLCVCDLSALLEMSQSAVSHQLRVLRDKNMVKFKKEGKMARYYLADEHVLLFIKMGIEHAEE